MGSTIAMFYGQTVPVSKERHGLWCLAAQAGFAYSRNTTTVPLMGVEFELACKGYPIVFLRSDQDGEVMPAVLLGLRQRQNLHISESGDWHGGDYIPAFVRRYPFIFATQDGGTNFTLCLDEEFAGFNQEGNGERLFDHEGNRTEFLNRVLAFLQEYQIQYRRTCAFCEQLTKLDLLEEMSANVTLQRGEKLSLSGFLGVNKERLSKVDGRTLKSLMKKDFLKLIYAHLHSMSNFATLMDRYCEKTKTSE